MRRGRPTKDELQNLFDHLERALDQSGFLRHKAMRPAMVNNLRALLQRADHDRAGSADLPRRHQVSRASSKHDE